MYGSVLMGRQRQGELSASTAAVLGLLVEEPDGAKGLERRLQERFASAQWSYSTAHSALKSLTGQGYVRIVGMPPLAGSGSEAIAVEAVLRSRPDVSALLDSRMGPKQLDRVAENEDRYQATLQGIDVFWRWLRSSTSISAIREDLRTKIAFSRPEDAPRLVAMIKLEEEECQREYNTLHASLGVLEQRIGDKSFISTQEWSTLMMIGLIRDEAAIWFARMQQRERLRAYVEGLSEEAARRARAARQRSL